MLRFRQIIFLLLVAAIMTGCGTTRPISPTQKKKNWSINDNTKGSTKKNNGGGQSQNKGSSDKKSNSNHAANCKKLGVSASSSDNVKLYSECASWVGVKYKYGGTSKSGADCSGMTYMIYKTVYGKTLTRQSAGMLNDNCTKIKKSQLREGDLVFFRTDGKRSSTPNHVGIYLKENKFIHSSTSKGVIVSDITQEYYITNWIAAGRVK